MQLQAQLVPSDGYVIDCLALTSDAGGIDLAIPWELGPQLQEGEQLDLMLDASVAALRTEVVVQQLRPEDDALEVRLVYLDPDRVRLRMPGAVAEALRWSEDRYGRPAKLQYREGAGPWVGQICDLSATAGTLTVPTRGAPAVSAHLSCRIDLPDDLGPTEMIGRVEQVHLTAGTARVSLRFVGPDQDVNRLNTRIQSWLTGRRNRSVGVAV